MPSPLPFSYPASTKSPKTAEQSTAFFQVRAAADHNLATKRPHSVGTM